MQAISEREWSSAAIAVYVMFPPSRRSTRMATSAGFHGRGENRLMMSYCWWMVRRVESGGGEWEWGEVVVYKKGRNEGRRYNIISGRIAFNVGIVIYGVGV